MSHKLEQLYFKLEKILGFRNMQEKLEKNCIYKKILLVHFQLAVGPGHINCCVHQIQASWFRKCGHRHSP